MVCSCDETCWSKVEVSAGQWWSRLYVLVWRWCGRVGVRVGVVGEDVTLPLVTWVCSLVAEYHSDTAGAIGLTFAVFIMLDGAVFEDGEVQLEWI